jgi:DNA-binding NarL/FixJ family response regulator
MNPIRVLIADDHPFFRFGLSARLKIEPSIKVVGEATTGQEAVELAHVLKPDVILLDLNFKCGISGIEAMRQIRLIHPAVRILILTMFDDNSALAALLAGAHGYLLKDEDVERTVEAIGAIGRGERRYSVAIDNRIRAALGMEEALPAPFDLSRREREVLLLMVEGYTNGAIAERLTIEEHTVRNYVTKIYDALGLEERRRNRREAVHHAIAAGII